MPSLSTLTLFVLAFLPQLVGATIRSRPRWQNRQRIAGGVVYVGLGVATAMAGSGRRQP